jgi:hypothetical protein
MAGRAALLLLLSASAQSGLAPSSVSVTFDAPTLISANTTGRYADSAFALSPSTLFIGAGTSFFESVDGGRAWRAARACTHSPASGGVSGAPVRARDGSLRTYGTVEHVRNASAPAVAFFSQNATRFSLLPGGGVSCAEVVNANISFAGLPRPTACGPEATFGCPFRLAGGALVALRGGELLVSAMVFWDAPDDHGVVPTSLVAFASTDGGSAWAFRSIIADAAAFPASQEGPNENALSLLSDGVTVACVLRLDAGDGPDSHPYAHYALATSADGGRSWQQRGALPTAGAARPRLLHLGANGRGGVTPAPLLLTGGRLRDAALNASGWDIIYWVDAAGDGSRFDGPHSLSAVHDALAPAAWRFTPSLNVSTAPRQSTSYTSIIELDGGAAPSARARRVGITYNRADVPGQPDMLFFISATIAW